MKPLSVRDALGAALALWALALKDVSSVRAINVTARDIETQQSIRELNMICPGGTAVPRAQLIVAIDIASACGIGVAATKGFHASAPDG